MGIEDELDQEYAPAWVPEVGEKVSGRITDLTSRPSDWQPEPYWIVTLEKDDGERVAVHAFHFVLAEELKRIRPQVGHRIGIKYLGKPEGKRYESYRVVTENKPAVDWGSPAPEAQELPVQPDIPTNDFSGASPAPAPAAADATQDDLPF